MDRIFVWLMRLILSLAVLGALFFAFSWYVLSRSLPEYSKTVQLEQLIAPVEIVRDTPMYRIFSAKMITTRCLPWAMPMPKIVFGK
jgi:hypothetical protein